MEVFGGMMLIWALFVIIEVGLVIYALVDLMRRSLDPAMKLVWVLVILVFPILGSIASLIVNRSGTTSAV
jgi:hypothetical protein